MVFLRFPMVFPMSKLPDLKTENVSRRGEPAHPSGHGEAAGGWPGCDEIDSGMGTGTDPASYKGNTGRFVGTMVIYMGNMGKYMGNIW